MRLIIVRHGLTDANRLRICQGQTHGVLSEVGRRQSELAGEALRHIAIDAIYSSDLHRAVETAKSIAKYHAETPFVTDQRLRERYFGSLQGKPFPPLTEELPHSTEYETPDAIMERIDSFITSLLRSHTDEQTILIVSHGFAIRVMFALFNKLPLTELYQSDEIKNASVSIVEIGKDKYFIEQFNDTTHLN